MTTPERLEVLLAAAATDALGPEEARELDAVLAGRPDLRAELEALRGVRDRVDRWAGTAARWEDVDPSPDLDDAVARLGASSSTSEAGSGGATVSRPRLRPALLAAAVALVAVGSLGTLGVQQLVRDQPVEGPPGTLGAVEPLSPVDGDSALPARVEASFVAHTWGTEAVLDVGGTRPGALYEVFVLDESGRAVPAGAFLGSSVPVRCRMNAAVLREDVVGLRITDATGATVAQADAPRT
jgi:hypothetical protein